jgi:tyrosyl-tRNA synthetase
MSSMTLSEELAWRGFVNQTTYKDISAIDGAPINFYFGVDPSADSMTIGNLASTMMVRHFIDHGHKAVLLVGGATGMIGDPDGKKQERDLKTLAEVAKNKHAIVEQYKVIFANQEFEIVDNYDWFKEISFLDFLRDVGKHVPMRMMLGRDFIQTRLGDTGSGISYAEFSYSLIQGYDFLHLFRQKGVTLQLSGADQWGNSIAGVDLIRRVEDGEAHVLTAPLVVNKTTGVKFGKTEGGAIWLDSSKTSPYKFYQFWLSCDDVGVIDYLKIFTLLTRERIEDIEAEFTNNKSARLAQKTLAYEVTKLIHGQKEADKQQKIAQILFQTRDYDSLTDADFELLSKELPFCESPHGTSYIDALIAVGLAESKRQAREFISNGAVWNGEKFVVNNTEQIIDQKDASLGYLLLVRGKKNLGLIKIT